LPPPAQHASLRHAGPLPKVTLKHRLKNANHTQADHLHPYSIHTNKLYLSLSKATVNKSLQKKMGFFTHVIKFS
jgi:hypothetical protein